MLFILKQFLVVEHLVQGVALARQKFFLLPLIFMQQFKLDIHGLKFLLKLFGQMAASGLFLIQLSFLGLDAAFSLLKEGLSFLIFFNAGEALSLMLA